MHKTEGENNSSNLFADGPPGTRVEEDWLNAIQEEIANVIVTGGGLALKTASTETRDQLLAALLILIAATNSTDFLVQHNATTGTHKDITINDIKIARNAAETITISDTSDTEMTGGVIVLGLINSIRAASANPAFLASVAGDTTVRQLITANGDTERGDGGAGGRDTRERRTGAKAIEFDDNAGGDLTTVGIKAVDTNFSGDINLVTGKALTSPDVDGSGASSGRFLGGNGGFMWFDGVTTGTTAITLDSTLDWRDRWVSVTAYILFSATPANFVPGGATDNGIIASLQEKAAGSDALVDNILTTHFYSEQGSAATGNSPTGKLLDADSDTLFIYADSTSGNLKIGKSVDTGNEASFGLLVFFSDDQSHY